ncbi:tyrosine-type recombinase/integrase [Rivibacter subsaxonicus]|uniref:Site-specific recombinase XerC n=1 Tax=Rivibacter subsaxonicus TaxID=457575 RepID=A0A4V2FUJ3_9BURK|nr:site-specific integrase [Rivibacter subsaxonicus]RZU02156.1 site-specific recombinase XerC [Rivibacter subsaxonicus]
MPVFQLPSGSWRVQIRRKGLPHFDKVFETENEARMVEAEQLSLPAQGFQPAEITLRDLWEKYAASSDFRTKALTTQTTESGRIKPVLRHLGDYALKHLENAPGLIYEFIDLRERAVSHRTGKPLSSTSRRLEIAALSSVVIWAKKRRYVKENFVRTISRPGQAKRTRRVPPIEIAKIQAGMHHEDPVVRQASRFMYLMRWVGCRAGELSRLMWSNVNWPSGDAMFTNTKYKAENRRVHLTPSVLEVLRTQQDYSLEFFPGSPYVFTSLARALDAPEPFRPFNYSGAVKTLLAFDIVAAGFHTHAMRREFISRAIEEGMTYARIGKQTGQRSIASVQIYDQGDVLAKTQRAAIDEHTTSVITSDVFLGFAQILGMTPSQLRAAQSGQPVSKEPAMFTTNADIMASRRSVQIAPTTGTQAKRPLVRPPRARRKAE